MTDPQLIAPGDRSAAGEVMPVNLNDLSDARSVAVLSIPPQSRVLEVGSGHRSVARALVARRCHVWAIDVDSPPTRLAEPWCDGILLGDVETADIDHLLGSHRADTILFLDQWERLRDPALAIRRVLPFLAPHGTLMFSVPEVASVQALLGRVGMRMTDHARVLRSSDRTRCPWRLETSPPGPTPSDQRPDGEACRYVVTAAPTTDPAGIDKVPTLVSTLTEHLQHRDEQLARLTSDLAGCQRERRFFRGDVLTKDAYLARLRQEATAHQAATLRQEAALCLETELRQQSQADVATLRGKLSELETRRAAHTRSAAELARLTNDIRRQLERSTLELRAVHASVAKTLAQPRYEIADLCNAWSRKIGPLHRVLKRAWLALRQRR